MRKVDKIEIVRRAQARGMSYREIEHVTGITKPDRYVMAECERVAS